VTLVGAALRVKPVRRQTNPSMCSMLSAMEDWSRWYKKDHPVAAEKCFVELVSQLPAYIDSVIDFGCAAGRNLEPFAGRYTLYGVDIVPEAQIQLRPSGVTYLQSRLQEFPRRFGRSLERFVCIAHGVLMYLTPSEQRAFIEQLVGLGCKNFFFQEYDADTLGKQNYFEPTVINRLRRKRVGYAFRNPLGFEKRWFRPEIPAWVRLDA
jgi:hypothetical protein